MALWYILWQFGIFFRILVFWTKKNLATLSSSPARTQGKFQCQRFDTFSQAVASFYLVCMYVCM
jgi:hypothetical protein